MKSLDFLERYAAEHGQTAAEVLERFVARLRQPSAPLVIDSEVQRISGLVPPEIDAEDLHGAHLADKHR